MKQNNTDNGLRFIISAMFGMLTGSVPPFIAMLVLAFIGRIIMKHQAAEKWCDSLSFGFILPGLPVGFLIMFLMMWLILGMKENNGTTCEENTD